MVDNTVKIKMCSQIDEQNIKGFFGEYRYLSNFHVADIWYEGQFYPSTEAAYQAAKSHDPVVRLDFTWMTPSQAKKAGRTVLMRPDWDTVKDRVMYDVCLDKFTRHEDLKEKLLSTGNRHLEESNWWRDIYWGTYNGKGRNQLGITLMKIRETLAPPQNIDLEPK